MYLGQRKVEAEFPENVVDPQTVLPQAGHRDRDRPEGFPFRNYSEAVIARHLKALGASRRSIDEFTKDIKDKRFKVDDIQYRNADDLEAVMREAVAEEGVEVS